MHPAAAIAGIAAQAGAHSTQLWNDAGTAASKSPQPGGLPLRCHQTRLL
jgi:hypothetical protein